MKEKIKQLAHGVTLLEIMLVLAIAAMVVVMSIRYYTSSVTSQQVNTALSQIAAFTNAAQTLAGENGDYTQATTSAVTSMLPTNGMTTPWGTNVTITGTATAYTGTLPSAPAAVCTMMTSQLTSNASYDLSATTCPSSGSVDFVYTYNASS